MWDPVSEFCHHFFFLFFGCVSSNYFWNFKRKNRFEFARWPLLRDAKKNCGCELSWDQCCCIKNHTVTVCKTEIQARTQDFSCWTRVENQDVHGVGRGGGWHQPNLWFWTYLLGLARWKHKDITETGGWRKRKQFPFWKQEGGEGVRQIERAQRETHTKCGCRIAHFWQ